MDNLTHALAGAVIAKAGAERATPLAMATLVLAANAPDVDMASYLGGSYYALAVRRGITHGWAAVLALPLLVTAAMLVWDRRVRRRRHPDAEPARAGPVLGLAAVGVLTHPTLDWMNTYGMRWGLPFDGAWSYGDALFIVDPWIWLALGGGVFLGSDWSRAWMALWATLALAASALVLVAMPAARVLWTLGLAAVVVLRILGRPATTTGRRRAALAAGCAVCAYVVGLVAADTAARGQVASAAAEAGLAVRDLMVAPVRANPFVSDVEVRTPDAFVPGTHRWLGEPRVELFLARRVPMIAAPPGVGTDAVQDILARAREEPRVRDYLVWSRFPYARVERDGAEWSVLYADARYDDVPEAGGLAGVRVRVPGSR